ncbi:hypothetical protein BDN72DRAFT_936118 [Pluteus cervinus]|uniref:Uncharacterized protein n=1 Tax=Pluteus cervinus TaxID=181527 RepID=A0ACD3A6G1_9AGAR|nr:hypothetical protein BDN72DRAFT_936118 [Pluteus cervinus]
MTKPKPLTGSLKIASQPRGTTRKSQSGTANSTTPAPRDSRSASPQPQSSKKQKRPRRARDPSPKPRANSPSALFDLDIPEYDDEEEEEMRGLTDPKKMTGAQYAIAKGRFLGRYRFMYCDLRGLLELGMRLLNGEVIQDEDDPEFDAAMEARELFNLAPLLQDHFLVNPHSVDKVVKQLDEGRRKARGSDINSLKTHMTRWKDFVDDPTFDTFERTSLGFNHPLTGPLLCPQTLDWSDEGTQKGLRDGTIIPGPDDFPRLLWESPETATRGSFLQGFLRSPWVVLTCKHLYIGPRAAYKKPSHKSNRPGNAASHGVRELTKEAVAYAATLFRFVLSDQSSFSAQDDHEGKLFLYRAFYNNVVSIIGEMPGKMGEELLQWYDVQVFGSIYGGEDGTGASKRVKETSAMFALREEMRALEAAQAQQSERAQYILVAFLVDNVMVLNVVLDW